MRQRLGHAQDIIRDTTARLSRQGRWLLKILGTLICFLIVIRMEMPRLVVTLPRQETPNCRDHVGGGPTEETIRIVGVSYIRV